MVQMIVPPIVTTQLTGFVMGFQCQHRLKQYRCELWHHEPKVRCWKEGKVWTWEKLPAKLRKSVHAYVNSTKGK